MIPTLNLAQSLTSGPMDVAAAVTVTWNPSDKGGDIVLSNGDLSAEKQFSDGFSHAHVRATLFRASGKYYFEVKLDLGTPSNFNVIGVANSSMSVTGSSPVGDNANSWSYYQQTGEKYHNGVTSSYGSSYTTADIIGVAVDLDNDRIFFSKNGTWQNSGDPSAGTNAAFTNVAGSVAPAVSLYSGISYFHKVTARFKAADFSYSPPSGFSAWES